MNFHFAGISCPGRRGGSESGFKGRCLVLQQSSAFEKLLGRSCSDPNIKVQNTMICLHCLQKPPSNVLSKLCNFKTCVNIKLEYYPLVAI